MNGGGKKLPFRKDMIIDPNKPKDRGVEIGDMVVALADVAVQLPFGVNGGRTTIYSIARGTWLTVTQVLQPNHVTMNLRNIGFLATVNIASESAFAIVKGRDVIDAIQAGEDDLETIARDTLDRHTRGEGGIVH